MIKENNIAIDIKRTQRRKSISITIADNRVKIAVPYHLPQDQIDKLLKKKSKWIKEKLFVQSQIQPARKKDYVSGEDFLYLGRHYRLKVLLGKKYLVELKNGYLTVYVKDKSKTAKTKRLIKQWYLKQASIYLIKKTEQLASTLSLTFNFTKVREYKSRWGSCSTSGNIFYNWRLVMAPPKIIQYVVFHELMHLKEHNHSPKFWKMLRSAYPDLDTAKQWLVYNGHTLHI